MDNINQTYENLELCQRAVELQKEGKNIGEIAEEISVNRSTISTMLKIYREHKDKLQITITKYEDEKRQFENDYPKVIRGYRSSLKVYNRLVHAIKEYNSLMEDYKNFSKKEIQLEKALEKIENMETENAQNKRFLKYNYLFYTLLGSSSTFLILLLLTHFKIIPF